MTLKEAVEELEQLSANILGVCDQFYDNSFNKKESKRITDNLCRQSVACDIAITALRAFEKINTGGNL